MKILNYTFLLLFLCTSFSMPVKAIAQMGFSFDDPLLNKKAPEFKLATLNGPQKSMSESRQGKNTILFFWATWCPHCRAQLQELTVQKSEIESKGIKVILVDIGEDAQQVKQYTERNKVTHEVFLDENSEVADQYGLVGIPTFVFINKDGTVKGVEHAMPDDYATIFKKK